MDRASRLKTATVLLVVGTLLIIVGSILKGDADTATGFAKVASILGVGIDIFAAIYYLAARNNK